LVLLVKNIRKIVLGFSFLLAILIYYLVKTKVPSESLQITRLAQAYALTSVTYLYFALLASPLYSLLPNLPFKALYFTARRAIGVSAFFFSATHAAIADFGLLGGPLNFFALPNKYQLAIVFSGTALFILTLMASTSFDSMQKRLGRNWKKLHRFVYLAAAAILIHALMLGSHFIDLSSTIPKIFFIALSVLLVLEAIRFDKYLIKTFNLTWSYGISLPVVVGFLGFAGSYLKPPTDGSTSLGIHSAHVQLAREAQQSNTDTLSQFSNIPGLDGDRTKRYTVSFFPPQNPQAGETVKLRFRIYDASNGAVVTFFNQPYEEIFHLIIVNDKLDYFNHIHPRQVSDGFEITTKFPKNAFYHLYADFQPRGAIEQQIAFTLNIGGVNASKATQKPDENLTQTFGGYKVSLSTSVPPQASEMSLGKQTISFTIRNSKTDEPITNLKPYLATYGHLVMINQETYDYLHVHPYNLQKPTADSSFGPRVDFLPLGIYGPIKPGVYRAFGQFNHDGRVFVTDFTLRVE